MEIILLPSFDESLYEINYFELFTSIGVKSEFDSINDLNDYVYQLTINHLTGLSSDKSKLLISKLESLERSGKFAVFKETNDLANFLSKGFQSKFIDLSIELNINSNQLSLLKGAIFNYYICSIIEDLFKKQNISKKLDNEFKRINKLINSFDDSMDELLRRYDNDEINHNLRKVLDSNIKSFKEKMRNDIEYEATGILKSENQNSILFFQENVINYYFKTATKQGRRPTRAINSLLLNLYEIFCCKEKISYLPEIMITLEFLNLNSTRNIEGLVLTENSVRKRIKDVIKLKKKQQKQLIKQLSSITDQNFDF